MQKYLIVILIFLFTAFLAVLIWGGVTNWKFFPGSSPTSRLIPDSSSQLTTTNECNPSRGCNVCAACCQSYIPDGTVCDGCVAAKCNPCKPDSTGKCGPNVCSYCCNSFIGQSECAGCISSVCQACSKNGTMGGDGKCVCDQEYEACGNYNQKQSDCVAQSDKFGNKVCQYNSDNTCTSKTTWMGKTCQYSRGTTCNSRGNVDTNGVCTCDVGYAGKNCEYSRANCNNRGNPSIKNSTLACECDFGWAGDICNKAANVTTFNFDRPSNGDVCTQVFICPMPGVTFSGPYDMADGELAGTDMSVTSDKGHTWNGCIEVNDSYQTGPTVNFNATYANTGKKENITVNKDCCGGWCKDIKPVTCSLNCPGTGNISGIPTGNCQGFTANGHTDLAGGMIIGMPL